MKVPFKNQDSKGIVYTWIGSQADPDMARVSEDLAYDMFDVSSLSIFIGI